MNSENSESILNSIVKISIAVGILLISLSISYYFIIFIPSREKEKIKNAELKETQRQYDLNVCILSAGTDSSNLWKANCKAKGLNEDCTLPLALANSIDKKYQDEKEDCFKQFPKSN